MKEVAPALGLQEKQTVPHSAHGYETHIYSVIISDECRNE